MRAGVGYSNLSGRRILLVEDIKINRGIVTELLAETHVEIDESPDGQKAVEQFANSPINAYDLIFMDVQMPNMNGYEATRQIRILERPDAKTIPIIAMTANAFHEDIENAKNSGMNEHIAKPIDYFTLIDKIKNTSAKIEEPASQNV